MNFLRITTIFSLLLTLMSSAATAQKASLYDVEHIPYHVSSGTHSNRTDLRAVMFRHAVRIEACSWIRLEVADASLSPGDYIRIVSLEDGIEQHIRATDPQFSERSMISVLFNGGNLDVELNLAPGSRESGFSLASLMIARGPGPFRTQCGPSDDRFPMNEPCIMRIVDSFGLWGTGFMIGRNCLVTANHVMTDGPWILERNVPVSNPLDGDINHPGAEDQFFLMDLSGSLTSGTTAFGNDWAVVVIPDNSFGAPGESCHPEFNWTHTNDLAGEPLFVQGFGKEDSEFERNGVLQQSGGLSMSGGYTSTHFLYQVDTESGNSGSGVVDGLGRIVGIHAHGGCTTGDPPQGANGGTLISNPELVDAITVLAVDLLTFKATHYGSRVVVKWETSSEINNAGFHIWRCRTETGLYTRITGTMIPAEGGPHWGAVYTYADSAVAPEDSYYYKLESLDMAGLNTFHGPIETTAGDPPGQDGIIHKKIN